MSKLILEPQVQAEPSEETVALEAENEILSIADTASTGIIDTAKEEQPVGSLNRKWIESFRSLAESPVSYGAVAGQVAAAIFGGSEAGAASTPIATAFHKMANDRYESSKKITADLVKEEAKNSRQQKTLGRLSPANNLYDTRTNELLFTSTDGRVVNQAGQVVPTEYQGSRKVDTEERIKADNAARIDESRANRGLRADQFEDKKDENRTQKLTKMADDFFKSPTYKDNAEALTRAKAARLAIQNNSSMAQASVRTTLARLSGEKGALSENDVQSWNGSQSLKARLSRFLKTAATGTLTDLDRKEYLEMIDVYEKVAEDKIRRLKNDFAKSHAKRTKDFTEDEAREILDTSIIPNKGNVERVTIYDSNGKAFTIPRSQLEQALRKGYKRSK